MVFLFASVSTSSTDFPYPSWPWPWPCSHDTSAVKNELFFWQGRNGNSKGQLGAQVGLLSLSVLICGLGEVMLPPSVLKIKSQSRELRQGAFWVDCVLPDRPSVKDLMPRPSPVCLFGHCLSC